MAFFGHLGNGYNGPGSMPYTTYNTVLDDIVADLVAAVAAGKANGWSLWDDQRNLQNGPTTMNLGYAWSGGRANLATGNWTLTQNSATVSLTASSPRATWMFAPSNFQIQLSPAGLWSPNIQSITDDSAIVLASNWPNATATNSWALERVVGASGGATYGYIVLKCTSQNGMHDFFVVIYREPSFGDLVRIDVFETWDNVAHSGTGGSPQGIMHANGGQTTMTTQVGYAIWFLPDTFAMGTANNFCYVGNLDPLRGAANDPTALVMAFSDQSLSGWGVVSSRNGIGSGNCPSAGGAVLRTLDGTLWNNYQQNYSNCVALAPRGMDATMLATPATSDRDLRFLLIGVDAYAGVQSSFGADTTGKRGGVRYLKYPVMNPTSRNQTLVGPCDDGNTYLCWTGPFPRAQAGYSQANQYYDIYGQALSGFAHWSYAPAFGGTYTSGEVIYGAVGQMTTNHRFYALPVNL